MGNARREIVATASMVVGSLAVLSVVVAGFLWMGGAGRPLVHARELDCTLTNKITSNYGDTWLGTAECGGFDLAPAEVSEVDLVEGGVYRFTIGETDPIMGDVRTVAAKIEEPVPPRALGEPGVPRDLPITPWAALFIPVAIAAGIFAVIGIAGSMAMWWLHLR